MTDQNRIMVDIESLGTTPYSAILSIGACNFNPLAPVTEDPVDHTNTFYQAITLESCLAAGLKVSAPTIAWWMDQSEAARQVFSDPRALALPVVLDMFTDWLGSRPDPIYGNSARFDLGLIEAAYLALGKELPWNFRSERCYRTMGKLAPDVVTTRIGVYHNALDDALYQAYHLTNVYRTLGLKE
jgi:hypothetical protein